MQQRFFVLIAIGFLVTALPHTAAAGSISAPPNNLGLVAYWSFDDGSGSVATDFSGNTNHGNLSGGPSWVTGKRDTALFFDGSDTDNNQTVVVPAGSTNPELAISGDVTISAWIKPSSSYYDTAQAALRVGQGSDLQYSLFYNAPSQYPYMQWYDGSFKSVAGTTGSVPLDQWSHVTIVRSGTTLSFYVNGSFTNSGTVTAPTVTAASLAIGRTNNGAVPQDFSGVIDEMRIYNRAMGASEIQALYERGRIVVGRSRQLEDISGLVGWWAFDGKDVSGTTLEDRSGNNIDGTITGAVVTRGIAGQGMLFEDTDSVTTADNAALHITDYTLAFWIRQTTALDNNWNLIVGNGDGTSASDGTGGRIPAVYFNNSADGALHWRSSTDVSGNDGLNTPAGTVEQDEWVHIVGIKNGTDLTIYKNGIEIDNVTLQSATSGTGYGGIRMRSDSRNTVDFVLDDVRFYNRAITEAELKRIYNANRPSEVATTNGTGSLADGLIGLWSFDGPDVSTTTAIDRSGSSMDGTLTNSPEKTIGVIGQALTFNDVDDSYVEMGAPAAAQINTGTVSAWVKTTNPGSSFRGIITKSQVYGMYLWGGIFGVYDNGTPAFRSTGVSLDDGEWHHVVSVFDSGVSNGTLLYIDGELVLTTTTTHTGSGNLRIGIGQGGVSQIINGSVDNVRLYNRRLSASEVQRLYNQGRR